MKSADALSALAALAHESRLAVYRLLVGKGPVGMPAGEIAEHLGVAAATLSFHLKHLRAAELVTAEREGRVIRYRANFDNMRALVGYLTDHCCGGDPSACLPSTRRRTAAGR